MKPLHVILAAIAATSLFVVAAETIEKLPAPWIVSGALPEAYTTGIDHTQTISGKGAKFIHYAQGDQTKWATIMQVIKAENYVGQRIRFVAKIKTKDVDSWAGLWMRIDTPKQHSAAFYNSQDKPIKGTNNWQERSVVLDVPTDASAIAFGVIDGGKGQVWIDDLRLEIVDKNVPVDHMVQHDLAEKPSL